LGDRFVVSLQSGNLTPACRVGTGGPGGTGTGNVAIDGIIARFRFASTVTTRAALVELHNEMIEISKLPETEQKARIEQLRAKSAGLPPLARLLFPAAEKSAAAFQRSRAQRRTTIAALAAERYRKANGRWPESPSVLAAKDLKEVPADPDDGAP